MNLAIYFSIRKAIDLIGFIILVKIIFVEDETIVIGY